MNFRYPLHLDSGLYIQLQKKNNQGHSFIKSLIVLATETQAFFGII